MESIFDNTTLRLPDAKNTKFAGESLAKTLYTTPVTLFLTGDLGVGKTTFLQGFAKELGISEHLTSPTYALEQRYKTNSHGELLHMDLFRLSKAQAEEVVATSDDHEGIRCIEWSDRLAQSTQSDSILINISEEEDDNHTRILNITFNDIPLPSSEEVNQWREEAMLQPHIIEHCEVVANFAVRCAEHLKNNGIIVRSLALKRAGQLHDLLRFFDFHIGTNATYAVASNEAQETWEKLKQKYPNVGHEEGCSLFLQEQGYSKLAEIITPHGFKTPNPPDMTIEQKLLFYADKRVKLTEVVPLEERFEDFKERYADGKETEFFTKWFGETRAIEEELFGNNTVA
ncbi:MAG: tRNA (adenosine(37)-N6)-threonylcarbamoyltransferase complex ATPase subunit type 1 TsaE [Kiritimatiellales bacterium]|nr:tRNA (adenosine(37)-N6)-threonylcarbamoyltransferase complex ATPase subunit type 1 TsaE [Kiritimatiellales bacterium]